MNKPKKNKRLLFVVNEPKFFLSHRFVLAKHAAQAGYEVHVAAADESESQAIREAGFFFHPFSISKYSLNPIQDIATFFSLIKLYRKIRPTILHHVTIKPVIYGSMASYFIPGIDGVVNAVSGLGFIFLQSGWKAKVRRAIVLALYKSALCSKRLKVITQNPDDEAMLLGFRLVKKDQLKRIRGSGVNQNEFCPLEKKESKPCMVLVVSRLLREKGIAEFVAAAKILKNRGVVARFVVAGARPPGNPGAISLEDFERWQKESDVEFLGERKDVRELYAQSDIVCLPSYREGLPKVLIEAAACGKPIVTTDVPGCREIVEHQVNGLLVPAQSIKPLADALAELINSQQLRSSYGSRSREIFLSQGFSETTVVAQHLELYQSFS